MKKVVLLVLLSWTALWQTAQAQRADLLIADSLFIPEGIAYDRVDSAFFVGSTYQRKIVRIGGDGSVRVFSNAPDLLGVLGMKVDAQRRKLWAASSNWHSEMPMARHDDTPEGTASLHLFDLETGAVLQRWRIGNPGSHFLNDVDVLPDGSALVTDSRTGWIFKATPGNATLDSVARVNGSPNGIALSDDAKTAFVAVWAETNGIAAVDLEARTVRMLRDTTTAKPHGIDGLYWHRGALVGIQPFRADAKIAVFELSADRAEIARARTIGGSDPRYEQPTTGAIVNDDFWMIANSHLQTFLRSVRSGTSAPLRPVTVIRVPLN